MLGDFVFKSMTVKLMLRQLGWHKNCWIVRWLRYFIISLALTSQYEKVAVPDSVRQANYVITRSE